MNARALSASLVVAALCASGAAVDEIPPDPPPRWFRGNLHTHTLWSDGNDFPEMVAEWYRAHGYDFLALSDHNVLSEGPRWMPEAEIVRRGGEDALARYRRRFGEHWVQTREAETPGSTEVRLKPLGEVRALMEERGSFIMIQGEEITDSVGRIPVHLNATNLAGLIEPQGGASVRETIANNLRAVAEQSRRLGRPILGHLNHPNYGWAVTAEDLAAVVEEPFFEVHNGHTGVRNLGDADHVSVERMWDIANTIRIADLDAAPLLALATDDSHHYHDAWQVARPGRAWIMVRARHLTPESLIAAMEAGDFYASTGVTLTDVRFDRAKRTVRLEIEPDGEATFTTHFIGTRRGYDRSVTPRTGTDGRPTTARYSADIGATLATVEGLTPSYRFMGDELYVRAVVISSRAPEHSTPESQRRKAWTQPMGWK